MSQEVQQCAKTNDFAEAAKAGKEAAIAAIMDRKEELVKLDFSELEKLTTGIKAVAGTNSVCGAGC